MEQEHTYLEEKVNPFFSIWFSTRKTVRYVVDHKPLKYSLIIAAIAGIPNALNAAGELSKTFNLSFWLLILGALILGPLFGLIGWGISTVAYTLVGKWLGGFGTYKDMGKAMGVVLIPLIWMTPYWILSFLFAYNGTYQIDPTSGFTSGGVIWMIVSALIMIILSIWMIFIQSKAIGEVHQFSSLRGFGTLIIPSIVLGVLVFIIMMIILFAAIGYVG